MRIFVLFNFVFNLLCFSKSHGHGKENPKVLLVSFDGFRYDYFELAEKFGFDLKYFKKVFKLGFKADHLDNVFLTRTFPNHLSIITGCYEETHGIIDNEFFDPDFNETFSCKNITQSLQSKWFSNSEPLWATNIINHHSSAVFYWPGYLAPYKSHISPTYSFGVFNSDIPLNYKFDSILKWLSKEDTTLGIVYHSEPDESGHKSGPYSKILFKKLKELDNSLQYLMNKINYYKLQSHLNVIIVSDHGMSNITSHQRIIMDKYVDPKLYNLYTHNSYTFWGIWPKPTANISNIFTLLKSVPHVTVYRKEEIPKEWHYGNNRRVSPIVILADEGWLLVHNENETISNNGTHGYSISSKDMKGIFIAWGPDIAAINRSDIVIREIDVFPLIAEILKFNYLPKINGSLSNVRWLLKNNMNEAGIFTSLVIICVLSLISALSACIIISCAHYNANALRVQKVGNTYVLKSGNLVRKWQEKRESLNRNKNANSYKYKIFLKNKSKSPESDAAFLLESHDEDEILGDIPSGPYKFNS